MTILPENKIDHAAALRVLERVGASLDARDVPWWIDYGTVLGAAREGGMIPWDSDIDIGVFGHDQDDVLALVGDFRRVGMDADYKEPSSSKFDGGDWLHVTECGNPCGVDVFFWFRHEDGLYCRRRYAEIDRWKGRAFPLDRLLPLQRIEVEGQEVSAPADMEWFAEHRYGASWREPVHAQEYIEHLEDQGRVE